MHLDIVAESIGFFEKYISHLIIAEIAAFSTILCLRRKGDSENG
jgi:hypothetical protein